VESHPAHSTTISDEVDNEITDHSHIIYLKSKTNTYVDRQKGSDTRTHLVVGAGYVCSLGSSQLVLGKVQVHFIAIEIGVECFAVGVVQA
jgi:hypothetical protein